MVKKTSLCIVQFKKISILPPTGGIGISWGMGGSGRSKKYKEMYEAFVEFPAGWGGDRKNPFRGEGMDIFWNYTLCQPKKTKIK